VAKGGKSPRGAHRHGTRGGRGTSKIPEKAAGGDGSPAKNIRIDTQQKPLDEKMKIIKSEGCFGGYRSKYKRDRKKDNAEGGLGVDIKLPR